MHRERAPSPHSRRCLAATNRWTVRLRSVIRVRRRLGRVARRREMNHPPRRQVDDEERVDLAEQEVVDPDEVAALLAWCQL